MNLLKNKIVLITGASSGIGAACARQFAAAGARLLLCARRVEILEQIARQLHEEYGAESHVFRLDVSNKEDVKKALASLPVQWQTPDILINNAGLATEYEAIQDGNPDDWDVMIDTNLKGVLYLTREILPSMIKKNTGYIINIGSVAGHEVYLKGNVYCATKHAINAITRCLRIDLSGTKIRVSSIDPGMVETNFSVVRFKGDQKRADSIYENMMPLVADDIADAVVYCASRPPHVNISDIVIMPTDQASATIVARDKT